MSDCLRVCVAREDCDQEDKEEEWHMCMCAYIRLPSLLAFVAALPQGLLSAHCAATEPTVAPLVCMCASTSTDVACVFVLCAGFLLFSKGLCHYRG